jgi:uracil-DNA glycosylase family 4
MPYNIPPPRDVSFYGTPQEHGARCDLCPLQGNTFVPYSPPTKKLRLVLVGEGPGRVEVIRRTPFCGPTGQILTEELTTVGLDREEAHVTNATLCVGETDQENEQAAECCAPRLLKELADLPANVPIVVLGKAATRAVLGVKAIFLARGFVWTARDIADSVTGAEAALRKAEREKKKVDAASLRLETVQERQKLAGRTVLPTLHPTFAFIHNETWADHFRIDLDRAARWMRGELTADMLADKAERVTSLSALRRKRGTFLVTDNVDEIAAASKIIKKEVGVDIETERLKPLSPLLVQIFTVQISDGERSIVISPWDKERHAAVLTKFLKGRTAVFHNGWVFDQVALERDGVSFDGVQLEDTLTAHHAFASCFPQKLDHVVSTFLDSSPWKVRFGVRGAEEKGLAPQHGEEGDLELYGACDAIVTIKAWRAMQADLAPEWAVYEYDKRRSILYKALQVTGYPVDKRRKRLLSKLLQRRAASLKGRLRTIARRPEFQPSKLGDVRHILFYTLKAPMLNPTKTGLVSTSNATLESLRTGDISDDTKETRVARFAEGLLNWRVTLKSKNTYVDPVVIHPDGRAHYTFKPFGVITGRPASRILSAPRWSKKLPERVREIYRAEKGRMLVYFDLAQAEARFAANLSGDAGFIAACTKDVHTANAKILFPDAREMLERDPKGKKCPRHSKSGQARAECNCGKPYRDVTKNAFFAIIYQAHPSKVLSFLRSQGFAIRLDAVEAMFAAVRDVYADHDRWVKELVRYVEKHGYIKSAIARRKIVYGFHPKPTDISNAPVQSGIADIIDTRLLDVMVPSLPFGDKMILHHYDSATFDVDTRHVDFKRGPDGEEIPCGPVVEMIENTWKEPVRLKDSIVCRGDREFLLPAEVKVAKRWSEL